MLAYASMQDALGSSPSTTSRQANKQKARGRTKKSVLGGKAAAIHTTLDGVWSSSCSYYLGLSVVCKTTLFFLNVSEKLWNNAFCFSGFIKIRKLPYLILSLWNYVQKKSTKALLQTLNQLLPRIRISLSCFKISTNISDYIL